MPDGSGVMFMLTIGRPWNSGNGEPPPKFRPGRGVPSFVGVWQPTHSATDSTRYLPRSTGVFAGCEGCGAVIGFGMVLTRYSSGPGRFRLATMFRIGGIVLRYTTIAFTSSSSMEAYVR